MECNCSSCKSYCECMWCHSTYPVSPWAEDTDEGVCPKCAGAAEWASRTVFPQWDEQV